MKKTSVLIIILLIASKISAQWTFLGNPFPIRPDFGGWSFTGDDNNIFVGGFNSIAHSTDKGLSWSVIDSAGINAGIIHNIYFSGKSLFAAGDISQIFMTTNLGNSWQAIDSGKLSHLFSFIEFDSLLLIDCLLFKEESDNYQPSIFSSTDHGISWDKYQATGLPLMPSFVSCIPYDGLIVGKDEYSSDIFTSSDNGLNWENVHTTLESVYPYTSIGKTLFGAGDSSIYKSVDTGRNWIKIYQITPFDGNQAMKFISSIIIKDSLIFASSFFGNIIYSSNGGNTWNDFRMGVTGEVRSLYKFQDCLFAATSTGIWRRPFSELEAERSTIKEHFQFSLLSNPLTSSADFKFEPLKEPTPLELFDLLGRQLLRREIAAGEGSLHIDMQSYPAGVYFARLGGETIRFAKM
jgi:photosystem II stability/assembly factor-like uncharacterized protein